MKENIETKDVQRTEYLDKNGLDMLWAKVKENTRNQVEEEKDRAITQENRIIDTKADKSELHSSYVSNSTFTALQEKVAANTDAIRDKQDTGNYLSYKTLNNEGYYEIPDIRIPGSGGITKTDIDSQSISVNCDYPASHTTITCDGISSTDNNANHVYATDGSIADLTQYIKKGDTDVKFVPYVKKDLNSYNSGDAYYLSSSLQLGDSQEHHTVITHAAFDARYGNHRTNLNVDPTADYAVDISNLGTSRSVKVVWDTMKLAFTPENNNVDSGTTYSLAGIHLPANLSSKKPENTLVLGTDEDYKEIGVDIAPLENDKVPTKYLTSATKESLGVVKVGDGLNVTDGTISVDPEYFVNMKSYGVEWDITVADPACTRIGNPLLHKQLPIQSEYKGCLVKNGKVNYYLDPNDWSKKADGTPSVLDGTDGDVMVHIPKFYGKSGSNGNKRWVRIATTKIDSSWVEIPEMFVSAYKITTFDDSGTSKVASVVNTTANYRGGSNKADYDQYLSTDKFRTDLGKPRTNVSRAEMRTIATNSGQELLCYEFYKWVFYWAYVIEYANFNSQKEFNSELTSDGYHQGGLGEGVTGWSYGDSQSYNNCTPITPCGYTNEFGNFSGIKQVLIPPTVTTYYTISEKEFYANRWRGFENPFGDTYTSLDGSIINIDSEDSDAKVYTTSDSSKFGDDESVMSIAGSQTASSDKYIKEFDLGETGEIIPKLVGGSESTYKCDKNWRVYGKANKVSLRIGGNSIGDGAGLVNFSADLKDKDNNTSTGFRSVIRA